MNTNEHTCTVCEMHGNGLATIFRKTKIQFESRIKFTNPQKMTELKSFFSHSGRFSQKPDQKELILTRAIHLADDLILSIQKLSVFWKKLFLQNIESDEWKFLAL